MPSKTRSILGRIVVAILLAAAVYYVVSNLRWRSHAKRRDDGGAERLVEIVEMPANLAAFDRIRVRDKGGQPYWLDRRDVVERDQGVPWIEFGVPFVIKQADRRNLLIGLLIVGIAPFLGAIRLRWLLGVHDIRLSLWLLVKVTFAGNFFNLFMPGLVTGDAVKAYYLWRHTPKRAEVLMIMLADRVIGLLGLLVVAAGSITVALALGGSLDRQAVVWIMGLLAAGVAGGAAFFSRRLRRLFHVDAIIARLPFAGLLARLDKALLIMRDHKRTMAMAMGITLVVHLLILTADTFVGWGFRMKVPLSTFFLIMPLASVAAAIPILPQGIGQMEFVLIEYFKRAGTATPEQACMLAIGARLVQWLWALPGCLVPLLGGHLPSTARMRQEVEQAGQAPAMDAGGSAPQRVA